MYRIGIDLGGTNIAVGAVNEFGRIVAKKTTPTLAKRESDDITADMARLCLEIKCKLSEMLRKNRSVDAQSILQNSVNKTFLLIIFDS